MTATRTGSKGASVVFPMLTHPLLLNGQCLHGQAGMLEVLNPYSGAPVGRVALEAGGVIVNDASAFRADYMPYSGVKESGLGREGVGYAIEEMTAIEFASLNPRG